MSAKRKTTEAELRELSGRGMNWRQVAEHLGMPVQQIRQAACALGIRSGRAARAGDVSEVTIQNWKRRARMIALAGDGMHYADVAKAVGVSASGAYKFLKRHGVLHTVAFSAQPCGAESTRAAGLAD